MFADSELDELLHDPVSERLRRRVLTDMAANDPDPLRRDLAKDLLSAAITPMEAARSEVYGGIFAEGAEGYLEWWRGFSDDDREEMLAAAPQRARALLAQFDAERDGEQDGDGH